LPRGRERDRHGRSAAASATARVRPARRREALPAARRRLPPHLRGRRRDLRRWRGDGRTTRAARTRRPGRTDRGIPMTYPIISADSHVTEPGDTYVDYIDPAFRDRAPKLVDAGELGDVFVVDGFKRPVVLGTAAAAGKPPEKIRQTGDKFEDLHR